MEVTPDILRELTQKAKQDELERQKDYIQKAIEQINKALLGAAKEGKTTLTIFAQSLSGGYFLTKESVVKIREHYEGLGFSVGICYDPYEFHIHWD